MCICISSSSSRLRTLVIVLVVVIIILTHQTFQLELLRIPEMSAGREMAIGKVPVRGDDDAVRFRVLRVRGGPSVRGVEVEQHADEQEHEEGHAVEDEDVGDVRDVCCG